MDKRRGEARLAESGSRSYLNHFFPSGRVVDKVDLGDLPLFEMEPVGCEDGGRVIKKREFNNAARSVA